MSQRSDEFHQKLTAYTALSGLVIIGLSLVCITAFPSPYLAGVFAFTAIVGAVLFVLALVYGVIIHYATKRGAPRVEANCRVMARYGVTGGNEIMSGDWLNDSEGVRPYVRLYSPMRGAMEFECAVPVWQQCGEGMLGEAIVEGRWLSSFTPYVGVVPPAPPQQQQIHN